MSATDANKRKLAILIQEAFGLTQQEAIAVLTQAERVKNREVQYTLIRGNGGRKLVVEPLDFPNATP